MNAAIFSFVKTYEGSVIASVKLARFLSRVLELPIYEKNGEPTPTDLDVLIIINGAYAFAGGDTLETLGAAIDTAKRVVWVQQDYTVIPPKDESSAESPFRKAFRNRHTRGAAPVDYWTTCESYSRPGRAPTGHICGSGSRYVNWNVLTFDPEAQMIDVSKRAFADTMLYYGSYRCLTSSNRKDRSPYFKRYFTAPQVKTVISCPTTKFVEAGYVHENISHLDRIDISLLASYGLGLYIEDQMSHKEYHSTANRFYEMLSYGLGIVFQPEAARMLGKSGIEIGDFTLWDAAGAVEFMKTPQAIALMQRELWWDKAREERESLPQRTRDLWVEYTR